MTIIESLNHEYERERFQVKMKHIYERKHCEYLGKQQTHLHNMEKQKERFKIQKKKVIMNEDQIILKESKRGEVKRTSQFQAHKRRKIRYEPHTSQEEIEEILRKKKRFLLVDISLVLKVSLGAGQHF